MGEALGRSQRIVGSTAMADNVGVDLFKQAIIAA